MADTATTSRLWAWFGRHRANLGGVLLVLTVAGAGTWGYFEIHDLRDENECLTDAVGDLFTSAAPVRQAGTAGDLAMVDLFDKLLLQPAGIPSPSEQLERQVAIRRDLQTARDKLQSQVALREANPIPVNPCGVDD